MLKKIVSVGAALAAAFIGLKVAGWLIALLFCLTFGLIRLIIALVVAVPIFFMVYNALDK